ncbi:MAG: hypothetical protein HY506_00140 [Candidatus Yanofskybacteria bacterium]|nr:hypothetical protein [Candidatus Yanofskybacteria bacterium]
MFIAIFMIPYSRNKLQTLVFWGRLPSSYLW